MTKITRTIFSEIKNLLFKGKVIVIYGARQVGKTTLLKEISASYPNEQKLYLNCDELDVRQALSNKTSSELKAYIGNIKMLFIDEAHRVNNIGLSLKLLHDTFPNIQVVVTGSSSFDLANDISEPLTGRKREFFLYPFSINEIKQINNKIEINRLLERRIIYGMYPEVVKNLGEEEEAIKEITNSYLYKDILKFNNIRKSDKLERLLQALALQIGNEVSYEELSNKLDIDKKTVENYIQILEKAFIIFRLNPFSRNLRNELKKLRKIYFFDTGIRNTLINNFNSLELRNDLGDLWENFVIAEMVKYNNNNLINKNKYFWRTHVGQEIDYLEERGGYLNGYEIKWNKNKFKKHKLFLDTYENSSIELINKHNFLDFLE